jgi:hypothetical protein
MLQYIENGSSTLEEGEGSQNKLAGERIGFGRGQAPTSQFLCNLLLLSKLASVLACLGMSDAILSIFIHWFGPPITAPPNCRDIP